MNSVCKEIFRAIHEGKWLSIEYKNKSNIITKYWIGIKELNPLNKTLIVDGLHLFNYTVTELHLYVDSIISASMIDGSYQKINTILVEDIHLNPYKYKNIFYNISNLKILNYFSDCNRLDNSPYTEDYALIKELDLDKLNSNSKYKLNDHQFKQIVDHFQYTATIKTAKPKLKKLCINIVSLYTPDGLYVLAYKRLLLDVQNRTLKPDDEITVCREFTVNGIKKSILFFLDAEDFYLLDNFSDNLETIKDRLILNSGKNFVDDCPYVIAISENPLLDLNAEYNGILKMYSEGNVTTPIKAFFGEITERPRRYKEYPLALINRKVNLDQLLAINKSIKYPLTYIQGPPGTGKTSTIINTIVTAFFNEKTVLFSSYNNHPIDGVFNFLSNLTYNGKRIPFPILRLGNNEKVLNAISYIRNLYESTQKITVFEGTLNKNKQERALQTERLANLLKQHEEKLELYEKEDALRQLIASNNQLNFKTDLSARQLNEVTARINSIGEITNSEALNLLTDDEENLKMYLYYTSAKYIKRLSEPKYNDLINILYIDDEEQRVFNFNKYISKEDNLIKIMRVFPLIATTCISAHRLGDPKPYFDMVVIDEASQCNTAISLVPIIRGNSLVLVGDPQQLNPVILLSPADNIILKKKYKITDEYDYIKNSLYKTFLACDSVSDEILLSHHYRCHHKIINFNNKKYYNSKLKILSSSTEKTPLLFYNIKENTTYYKNTAPTEVDKIIQYASQNNDKSIGIITPFVNQRNLINEKLKENGLNNVSCGTVHAFQGDEKDIILFSLAITDKTSQNTYNWVKSNRELINVATSRAKDRLVIVADKANIERLHQPKSEDDLYELINYVIENGKYQITPKELSSRALGIKPYSTQTEDAFLGTLNHALDNILYSNRKCVIKKEVAISHVFSNNITYSELFYSGRFDFVVYEKEGRSEFPVLAIELDGKEHYDNDIIINRDKKKNEICRKHGFELIRVENTYARRYNYIKEILINYFNKK